MELRTFTYGMMTGIVILVAAFSVASFSVGIKWQPVKIEVDR